MIGAFLTTIFFSLSSIAANRATRIVGPLQANLARLILATILLGIWAQLLPLLSGGRFGGHGLGGVGLAMFLLSGIAGMGVGDLALYSALPFLGARLSVVITQCVAAPIAAFAEWCWLGTTLTRAQMGWSTVILGGVALALIPSRSRPPRVQVRWIGVLLAVVAAAGQGIGAVFSRKAYDLTRDAGQSIDGMTATYERIIAGFAVALIYFALVKLVRRRNRGAENSVSSPPKASPTDRGLRRWRWTLANALSGAVIGVSCYQWALSTTPSGIVLPIVATTPLVVVPLAYWFDGDRPTQRSLVGGTIAVAGAVCLSLAK